MENFDSTNKSILQELQITRFSRATAASAILMKFCVMQP